METHFFINESPLSRESWSLEQSFSNGAFLWGMSTFTTAIISQRKWGFSRAHKSRLRNGVSWLFQEPLQEELLCEEVKKHFSQLPKDWKEGSSPLKLRITVFENLKKKRLERLYQFSLFEISNEKEKKVVTLKMHPNPFVGQAKREGVKVGCYAETFRLRSGDGHTDCLFYDQDGFLLETSTANIIFKTSKGELITPKKNDGLLRGIGLENGLRGILIKEKRIHREDLMDLESAFLVNALRGIWLVEKIDEQIYNRDDSFLNELNNLFWKNFFEDYIDL